MTTHEELLTRVEQRLLHELLTFRDTCANRPPAAGDAGQSPLPRPHARRPRPRREVIQNAVVFAAILVVSAFLLARALPGSIRSLSGVFSGSAQAATPRALVYQLPPVGSPSGRRLLLRLAATADRGNVSARAPKASYAYVKTVGWYLDSAIGGGAVTSQVVPQVSQSWLRSNGSGRQIIVTGHRVDNFEVRSGPHLFALSTHPTALARQLAVGHPASDGPAETFVAFTDTAQRQPIPPATEAAILRLLARIPGLINSGTVIDRDGRPGVAVSLDSSYSGALTRYTLIFDPHTAQLLGEEETVIRSPRAMHLQTGSVSGYFMILNTGYVTSITSTP